MPYTPDPDNAAAPLDTEFLSSAAAEFRAFKGKVNSLFLSSAIDTDTNTIQSTKAFSTDNTGGDGSEFLTGLRGAVSRTGGTGSLVAGYFSASLGDSVTLSSGAAIRGLLVEAFTGSTDSVCGTPGISGGAFIVVQRNDAGQDACIGLVTKFQDRTSALDDGAVVGGLGDDKFNLGATAILVQSQRRSTTGEKCGWAKGLVFDSYSIDDDDNVEDDSIRHPAAIDFNGLAAYDSERMPVPFNFNGDAIEAVATTNAGAITPPTTLHGFLRVTVEGQGTYGIPVCSLGAIA